MSLKTKTKLMNNYEVETPEGFKPFAGVGEIEEDVQILKFTLEDGNIIEVSTDHTFIINGNEEIAKYLLEGDVLETKDGLKEIIKIELNKNKEKVYTLLEVESSDNSYYTNDVVSKNCKFLGSQSTLIDSDVLERIDFKDPVATKWNGLLRIYKAPIKGAEYVLGVDTGKGTGRDYSVIQVLWIKNEYDIEQVATYRSNMIRPHEFSQVCVSVAKYYNNAHMMIENNDIGQSVADSVWHEFEYEDLVNVDPKGLGIRSTKKSKLRANMLLKEYVEKDRLFICDENTLYELSRYEEVRPNVFAAGRHEHDDCFKEDALVKTKRGYIPIVDVKIGDEVLTHMGRWRKVTNLIKKEFDGDWYDIKFKGQLNLSCSYNHPIYTSTRSWVFARDWEDQSCVSVKMPIEDNRNKIYLYEDYIESKGNNKKIDIKMDSNFAKFLGLFLADGHAYKEGQKYHYRMTIAFDKKHIELIDEMIKYLNSIGISTSLSYSKYNNGCTIQFANKFLHYFMSQCYDDVRNKVLPSYAFDLGSDLKYVLEYWLKGDGWVCNRVGKTDCLIGASISKKLALDMRDIAISMGKKANIQHVVKQKPNEKDQYYVTIYDEYNKECNSQSINEISDFEIEHKISKIKNIKRINKTHFKGTVYNISVEEDESFVCDGIVVHNCVTSLLWALYFVITDDYEGKNYDTKSIEDDYNVQMGDWEHDEVSPNEGLEEQGNVKFIPSVILDDDII